MAIVEDTEKLDTRGLLNSDNLSDIYRILEDTKDLQSHIL